MLTGQRMALQGLLGMLMSAGSSGSALNSSQFLLSFFFSFFPGFIIVAVVAMAAVGFSAVWTAVCEGCVGSDTTDLSAFTTDT